MTHRSIAAALVLLLTGGARANAQAVSYSQSTFTPSQWAFSTISLAGPVTASSALVPAGGNPGDAWEHTWSLPLVGGISSYRVANINSTFLYNPGVHGALESLTFGFDALGLRTSGFSSAFYGFYVPTLQQNGVTFFASGQGITPATSWTNYTRSFTGTSVWVNPNNQSNGLRPDFSATGGVIQFGYIFSVNTDCPASQCAAAAASSRLDNFSVSAFAVRPPATVPEPASAALLAVGLAGLVVVRRSRRTC